jgi:hypothetical protein
MNYSSFALGCLTGYVIFTLMLIFIVGICMAAGRNLTAPEPGEDESELLRLEELGRSKIKVINQES